MWSLVPSGTSDEGKDKLKTALDLALKMTPLTPDHHFYMDQGTYARMRLVLMGVGRKIVELGGLDQPDDIMFLRYDELRKLSTNLSTSDAKFIVKARRKSREEHSRFGRRCGREPSQTLSMYGEPYKQVLGWRDLRAIQNLQRSRRDRKGWALAACTRAAASSSRPNNSIR